MAFLIEQAGGVATDGKNRILDIAPTNIHQRSPLLIGSKDLVERAASFIVEEEEEPLLVQS
jgi:fructose-1,6-bisphosphatase I